LCLFSLILHYIRETRKLNKQIYCQELMNMQIPKWHIKCVIYDCDGVLFDSLEANGRLYNYIATSIGREPIHPDELQFCHTHTVFEAIHHLFRNDHDMEEKALAFFKQIDLREFILYLKMEPNLLQTLATLKKEGIVRAISTNRTTSMKHIMERYELSPYFEMVVTALDVVNPKPHPESVEKILKTFDIEKGKVLYVGDSDVDRNTALSSGVKFIAYKNRDIPGDGFIDDHLSLLNFLLHGEPPR